MRHGPLFIRPAGFLGIVALVLLASLGAPSAARSAPAGLVAAYSFNEGAGSSVADASGTGNTGTINGAAWTTQAKFGRALSFNGTSDYVDLGNRASLHITGSMTWSAWVFATGNPVDDGQIIAKSAHGGGATGWQFKTSPDTGPHTFGVGVSPDGNNITQRYSQTNRTLNTWYHVAGVYDAAARQLHIYVNGVLDDGVLSGTVPASQFDPNQNVLIGRRSGGFPFQGTIDEVRVYDRALTEAEIQADMNSPISPSSTDPTPPTVSITAPTAGDQVRDMVDVSATASDNTGVSGVQFFVDGVATGAEDRNSPYGVAWDTHVVANGQHTLTALARDAAGNTTISAPVTVTVANTGAFQNEVLATGLTLPTKMAFLPDGRMLVAELPGRVDVLSAPYTQPGPTPFLQLSNVGTNAEQGLQNIVLDPNFSINHYFYVFYTLGSPNRDRLSRFTANALLTGTVAGSELVLYQDPDTAGVDHHGGAIMFGNDGKLYFTTGDEVDTPSASQSLSSPRGKIHRINMDGSAPTDNPFYDGPGPNVDSIWALGFRNPFRAYYDAPTGRIFVGDVGGNNYATAHEEVNLGVAGANYGWPNCEGNCGPQYKDPLYEYAHNGRDAAVVSGFVYRGSGFPSGYTGSYFFADYTQNWIRRLTLDAGGNLTGVYNVEPPNGALDGPYGDIVDLQQGPDGALYYLDIGFDDNTGTSTVSKVRRIRYVDTNQPPIAASSADKQEGPAPLTVNFSSAGSSDPEGTQLTYSWTFGDGTTSTAANPAHVYSQAGRYTVRLSVSDGANTTLAPPITIKAGTPPTATILAPQDGATFRAGDVISYSGDASDPEDGALPASAFSWTVDFLHAEHVHPGTPTNGVKSGTFTIPTSGHDFSGNTRYRITLTVTDSDGLTSTKSVVIWPEKVNLTFNTLPSGLTLYLDGIAKPTPFVYDDLIGFHHTLEARDQSSGATNYRFASWSDGGAQSHEIVVGDVDKTYTATFQAAAGPAPVAAYGFDEGSGTTLPDTSGNGNNGTINGATWTTGKYGGALLFNGTSSFVDLGNPADLHITGSMTWSAWVNATGTPADDGQIIAKSAHGAGITGWQFKTSPDTGPHTFGVGVSPDGSALAQRYSRTNRALNTWYHVAAVYDAAARELHIYVNGALDDGTLVGTVPASQFDPNQNVTIGRRSGGFNFQGLIDELRVYDRALTQAQIQADMNTPIRNPGPDTQPPSTPANVAATAASSSQINLSWTASTDNVSVTGYRVERCQGASCTDFTEIAQPSGTTFNNTGLDASTAYRYRVRAVDANGNLSQYSTAAGATTLAPPDTQPPTAPAGLNATAVSTTQVNLSWTAATDNASVTGYRVERCQGASCTDFTEIAQASGTTFNNTGLAANTTYRYRVRAVDSSNNLGPYSGIAGAATPAPADTQPPSAPSNLAVTATSSSQVDLSWTASTDNVGVTEYRVERCAGATCTNFVQVATPPGTSYSNTGLAGNTTYRYRVRAVDAEGNLSPYSGIAAATTPAPPDTAAPSAPANLTAAVGSTTQVNLNWTASTDNVGVTEYRVERCTGAACTDFAQIATPTGTSYINTGLTPNTTYRFRVRAVDAAQNLGGYSNIANATTTTGLVAAYSFNEGAGSSVGDLSGNANNGTVGTATWNLGGKYGGALAFNGTNARVTVPDAPSLRLTTGMTLEAWLYPGTLTSTWRDAIYKGDDNYYLSASSTRSRFPAGGGMFGNGSPIETFGTSALAVNTWTHLAVTYDGAAIRLYVNGTQVSSRNQTGNIATSANALSIGGDAIYGQYFNGRIDEVRVYKVARTAAEVQADMNKPL